MFELSPSPALAPAFAPVSVAPAAASGAFAATLATLIVPTVQPVDDTAASLPFGSEQAGPSLSAVALPLVRQPVAGSGSNLPLASPEASPEDAHDAALAWLRSEDDKPSASAIDRTRLPLAIPVEKREPKASTEQVTQADEPVPDATVADAVRQTSRVTKSVLVGGDHAVATDKAQPAPPLEVAVPRNRIEAGSVPNPAGLLTQGKARAEPDDADRRSHPEDPDRPDDATSLAADSVAVPIALPLPLPLPVPLPLVRAAAAPSAPVAPTARGAGAQSVSLVLAGAPTAPSGSAAPANQAAAATIAPVPNVPDPAVPSEVQIDHPRTAERPVEAGTLAPAALPAALPAAAIPGSTLPPIAMPTVAVPAPALRLVAESPRVEAAMDPAPLAVSPAPLGQLAAAAPLGAGPAFPLAEQSIAEPRPTLLPLVGSLVQRATSAPAPVAPPVALTPQAPSPVVELVGVPQPAGQAFAVQIAAATSRSARNIREDKAAEPPLATGVSASHVTTAPAQGVDRAAPIDTRDPDWTRTLIDRIDAVHDVANARDTRIRLVPEALGKIDVALHREGDTLHVQFSADVAATRALLAEAQPRLAELAEARGLRLGQASVDGGATNQSQGQEQRRQAAAPAPIGNQRTASAQGDDSDTDHRIA